MTDLHEGRLTDLIQNESAQNPYLQAYAFAISQEKRRILDLADRTRTISMIDELPENILDVLAVELRTPYYSGDMTIDQKREIIKKTLVWFFKAGTPAAVEELIAAVFGEGAVQEWFDYTEPPYTRGTFDIVTDVQMTEDIVEQFLRIIQQVKNTRSHIRRVLIGRKIPGGIFAGAGIHVRPFVRVANTTTSSLAVKGGPKFGIGMVVHARYTIQKEE